MSHEVSERLAWQHKSTTHFDICSNLTLRILSVVAIGTTQCRVQAYIHMARTLHCVMDTEKDFMILQSDVWICVQVFVTLNPRKAL